MFGELFGKYLVDEKVIDSATLKNLLKEQSETRVKLGMMAVAEGLLTEEQADRINKEQQKKDLRFGDIAIDEGILTEAQVKALVEKQGHPYMKFIQILVDETSVESADIEGHLEGFRKTMGFDKAELDAIKEEEVGGYISAFATSSQPLVTKIAGQVLRNMVRFATRDFYIEKLKRVDVLPYRALAVQRCYGDHTLYIGLAMVEENGSFLKLANAYTGEAYEDITAEAFDAVGEFINCVSGLITTELASERMAMDIAPQAFYEKQMIQGRGYVLPIIIDDTEIDLYISIDNDVTVGTNPLDIRVQVGAVSSESDGTKPTVVVVDDSGWSRKVLRDLLEKNGFAVVGEAADGDEAVEVYNRVKPDVITLDITMPKRDGIDALREIMKSDRSAKVAMITSVGQRSKVLEALKLGAEKFIVKPFDPNLVVTELQSLLKKK